MTQIVVTLEDNSNLSIIRAAINQLRGVKNIIVRRIEQNDSDTRVASRLHAAHLLAGSISLNRVDLDDDRTRYLLEK